MQNEIWNVEKSMRNEKYELRNFKCEVWTMKCEVWSVKWEECNDKWEMGNMKCEMELQIRHMYEGITFAECTYAQAWLAHDTYKFYK